ncbi:MULTISPECIES: hypothetical protein [Rhodopseudomonas]|uniref:Metallo-beta-lactamase domain-containing protein n=1 Tax=Rhodopseudomonas palustris TaxID=1076 RepID=A0A0D7EMI5_RHOPL|nr:MULTISPECIES: hypothetical protein [Rhodopseudomonas]KIZ41861.1 hypothetical protein OO17_14095 [Rhodopseudomonas palustris]MDF3811961.1 hypothetical protein [Rhodopseudomonas sp. BAL398]WOK19994.1 hypothetical protein RBJ75_10965 [Rhodopseudomonas sp. BAL398]
MFFSLAVLRARKGDCLMLHYGSDDDPHLMLIDGGPSGVYDPQLKPAILAVRADRGLDQADPLPVDVVMVSHVDDDHIKGILDLTKEQRRKAADFRLDVTSLWHNSFDDLLSTRPDELMAGSGAASVLAGLDPAQAFNQLDPDCEDQHQTVEVLASIPQGRTLRDDAQALGWKPNHKFKGKLILASADSKPVKLDGLLVTVVGPMQPELLALQEAHDRWIAEQQAQGKMSPEAMLAAFTDQSVPNLSSIVVLVECGKTSILLTGDARGDKILEGLELVGRLDKPDGKIHVDILKVPHHGSDNNMETVFFERVTADHYVFSGDGEHGNPERKTLQMLLDARGTEPDYTIHLTYPIDQIDREREADWIKQQAKEKKRGAKKVRPDWSPEDHGLMAFFAANPDFKAKVAIVDDGAPHLIELLDPM